MFITPLVKIVVIHKTIAKDLYFIARLKRVIVKKDLIQSKRLRSGAFVSQVEGFRAFVPKPLPPDPPLASSEEIQSLLALAERNLGRLDGLSVLVPDPDRFVYMYVRQEAVLSSQIEGTQASLADLLAFEASDGRETQRAPDVGEVVNYITALNS